MELTLDGGAEERGRKRGRYHECHEDIQGHHKELLGEAGDIEYM